MSSFTLSVDRPARQDGTVEKDFIPVIAWGKSAEYAAENLKPQAVVILEGRIQTRPVENNGQRTWTTEVVASAIKAMKTMTGNTTSPEANNNTANVATEQALGQNPFTEDDVPF